MGYALSWAAVKGGSEGSVHKVMGLRAAGQSDEIGEADMVGVELDTGWYLVMFNKQTIDERTLGRLSLLGEVVHCFVEDHVMFSSASDWVAGSPRWSVTHDCEKGRFHLQVDGQAPPILASIQGRLTAEQNAAGGEESDTDYMYDIPAELARELTGFRHDHDVARAAREPFKVLEPARRKRWKLFTWPL
jgi:hypothetical protein